MAHRPPQRDELDLDLFNTVAVPKIFHGHAVALFGLAGTKPCQFVFGFRATVIVAYPRGSVRLYQLANGPAVVAYVLAIVKRHSGSHMWFRINEEDSLLANFTKEPATGTVGARMPRGLAFNESQVAQHLTPASFLSLVSRTPASPNQEVSAEDDILASLGISNIDASSQRAEGQSPYIVQGEPAVRDFKNVPPHRAVGLSRRTPDKYLRSLM